MAYVLPEHEKQNTVKQPVKDNGGGNLQFGSSGEDVKKLQDALSEKDYDLGPSGADGKYGQYTEAAVRKYQADNQLTQDGIAGNETLSHLYGTAATGGAGADTSAPSNTTPAPQTPLQKAQELLNQQNQSKPSYEKLWDEQLSGVHDEIMNRDKFSYDVNQDPLYKQLQDQYVAQGQLAMMDAQGQSSALTGGYGSSYGQMVGQQTYQSYLQQITDKIPQLYELARANYDAEGQELLNKFSLIAAMSDREYNRYMDELNLWLSERSYLQGVVENERTWEYNTQQNEYSKLSQLISMGYDPTDEELLAAGMTRGQADTIFSQYTASQYKGGGGTQPVVKDELSAIPFEKWGFESSNDATEHLLELYNNGKGDNALYNYLMTKVAYGQLDETRVDDIRLAIHQMANPVKPQDLTGIRTVADWIAAGKPSYTQTPTYWYQRGLRG